MIAGNRIFEESHIFVASIKVHAVFCKSAYNDSIELNGNIPQCVGGNIILTWSPNVNYIAVTIQQKKVAVT